MPGSNEMEGISVNLLTSVGAWSEHVPCSVAGPADELAGRYVCMKRVGPDLLHIITGGFL